MASSVRTVQDIGLSSLLPNSEVVILNQLINVLNSSFSCNGGVVDILKKMAKGSLQTLAAFVIYYFLKNNDSLWDLLKSSYIRLFYRSYCVPVEDQLVFVEMFTKYCDTQEKNLKLYTAYVSGFPIYLVKQGMSYVLCYLRFIHGSFYNKLLAEFELEREKFKKCKTICRNFDRKTFAPKTLFASDNYLKLDKMVQFFHDICRDTENTGSMVCVLYGEAGTGKTGLKHYLGSLGKYSEIIYIDLRERTTESFSSIVKTFTAFKTNGFTIIIIDECDKYLEDYIEYSYSASQQGIKEDGELVDSDYPTFVRSVKKNFIRLIAQLNDNTDNFPEGVVYILPMNNPQTIYEDVRSVHVNSVKSRMVSIEFLKCDREEVKRFIRTFNAKITNLDIKCTPSLLEKHLAKLRPDLQITHRDIRTCLIKSFGIIPEFVEHLNRGVENVFDEIESSPEPPQKILVHLSKKLDEPKKIEQVIAPKSVSKIPLSTQSKIDKHQLYMDIRAKVFAMKNDDVDELMGYIGNENIRDVIQFMRYEYDGDKGEQPTIGLFIIRNSFPKCLRYIIENGNLDDQYITELFFDCCHGFQFEDMMFFIKNNYVNVYDQDFDGNYFLHFLLMANTKKAEDNKHEAILEVVDLIFSKGFHPNTKSFKYGNMFLNILLQQSHQMSKNICLKLIDLAVKYDADINIKDSFGKTPLMNACSHPHTEVIQHLIDLGASIDDKDTKGKYVLGHFVEGDGLNCEEIPNIELLLQNGADKNQLSDNPKYKFKYSSDVQEILDKY